ncbi:hypothetical protein F8N00_02450 [Exiguobacterium sp. A1_3_1]|uniref:hypothetical protein n=1 Tax=Exiguobacterium sp. A1_3_1 TaxID=2651871 RepID=UPI003B859507
MENKSCRSCGSTNFKEASDYFPLKPSKGSLQGAQKVFSFCIDCGIVDSIRIENTEIFDNKD